MVLAACTGRIAGGPGGDRAQGPEGMAGRDGDSGESAAGGGGQSGSGASAGAGGGDDEACVLLPSRVSRLQDRQLANAMRDLPQHTVKGGTLYVFELP